MSEAVYFTDPEGKGIELYRDRPFEEWPVAEPGRVGMFTLPLDLPALVAETAEESDTAAPDIGHIHLRTADVDRALEFWRDRPGLESFELRLRDEGAVDAAQERLERTGVAVELVEGSIAFNEVDSNLVLLSVR